MSFLSRQLADEFRVALDTTFVVGAGSGGQLRALRKLGSEKLVLVEAYPSQADALARHISPEHAEAVWAHTIVANPARRATLHAINNPLATSTRAPRSLLTCFPNLRVTNQIDTDARTLEQTISALALPPSGCHLLVLDAPGQSDDLLAATPPEALQLFTWILVNDGIDPLYEGATSLHATSARLGSIGFDHVADDPDAIYPFGSVLLRRNDERILTEQLKVQLQALATECAAKLDVLRRERDEYAKLATQHRTALDEATNQVSGLNDAAESHKTQIKQLHQQLADQKQSLEKRIVGLDDRLLVSKNSASTLQEKLIEAVNTAALSTKLQMLREADLEDLQRRYGSLLTQYQNQRELLTQLTEKLHGAAEYYHLLSLEDARQTAEEQASHQCNRIDDTDDLTKND